MIGDVWGISRPFEVAFCAFLLSSVYVRVAVPYIAAELLSSGSKPNSKGFAELLSPLRVLAPQKVFLETGATMSHYGVLFLCAGVFLGVVGLSSIPHSPHPRLHTNLLPYHSWLRDMRRC
jgi:hypothetical protein